MGGRTVTGTNRGVVEQHIDVLLVRKHFLGSSPNRLEIGKVQIQEANVGRGNLLLDRIGGVLNVFPVASGENDEARAFFGADTRAFGTEGIRAGSGDED